LADAGADVKKGQICASIFLRDVIDCVAMSAGRSIWDRLFSLVLMLLVIAGLMGVFLWYKPVIQANQRMRRDKLELERKIEKETEMVRKLEADLKALQNPATVERLARERLSYAKPGESVIHFDPPPGGAAAQ
jgi:cell division protein FtsB